MIQGTVEQVFNSIAVAGWGVKSGGSVESPAGHYTIVEIPDHDGERAEMREAVFSEDKEAAELFDTIEAGWYFVVQTTQGFIEYGKCKNRHYAFARFSLCQAAYDEWSGITTRQ